MRFTGSLGLDLLVIGSNESWFQDNLLRHQQVLDVRQSTSPVALLLGFGKRRQKQTGQDGKDGALATRYWPIAR